MARFALGITALFLLGANPSPSGGRAPALFALKVPPEMVTGPVVVKAETADQNVEAVRWTVDDWSRTTPRPFELTFDSGSVPYERRVMAVALDKERRPLYRHEAVLNPGGRGLQLEMRSPVDGQQAFGLLPIELQVKTPADDETESIVVDMGGEQIRLSPAPEDPGVFVGSLHVAPAATALVAKLRTRRGRETERTVLVNTRGVLAQSEVHVVEQLVGVSHRGQPLEDLRREEISVRDDKGECEIRDIQLLRDAPLALGFAVDISLSLRHTEELKQTTANQFIEQCLTPKDTAFVMAFGPAVVKVMDWTRSKPALKKGILGLVDHSVPGTALFEAIQKALYQFQGHQGARALILITDGHDYDGDVKEESALSYARQSGVKIYALGLTSSFEKVTKVKKRDADGTERVVETKRETIVQPSNVEVLSRFATATGGKTYLVKEAEDLPRIYREIDRDIRTQYLVSYVSGARRMNLYHPVEVKTRRGTVHTVSGFFY